MKNREITVVVPSYNSGPGLIACIDSLKRQDSPGQPFNIVVIDSSSDDTPDLLRKRFPDVKMVHSDSRLLPGAARNKGVSESPGVLVAFIDSDCVADRHWISRLADTITRSHSGIVGGSIRTLTGFHPFGAVSYLTEFSEFLPGRGPGALRFAVSANMICDKEAFSRAGGFLDGRLSGEDRILSERVARSGGEVRFCPDAVVFHRDRKSFSSLVKHQFNLGLDSAKARKIELLEGQAFVRMPFLIMLAPCLRFSRLLYRLIRYREYRYLLFAIVNMPTFICAYSIWACGFFRGVTLNEGADDKAVL